MQTHSMNFNEITPHVRYINLLQCNPGFVEGPRMIYDHQFVYVHKGRGRMEVGGQLYTALPGDLFFYGPGIAHTFYADSDEPYLLTGIHFDFTGHFKALPFPIGPFGLQQYKEELVFEKVEFLDFPGFPAHMSLSDNTRVREMILDMLREFEGGKIYTSEYINGLFSSFLAIIARHILTNTAASASNNELIDKIIHFIQEHYNENFSNKLIAANFHFHHNYLNQLMVAHTGVSIRQYMIDFRIRKALNLLMHTSLSIAEAARSVGYEDPHYFSRIFRKKTGFSPLQIKSGLY